MSLALGIGAAGLALSGVTSIANLGMQISNYRYQKDLQQDIFSREDSSIQRRVADLKAAGLSPVLAAGQGASAGQVIKTDAPQYDGNPLQDAMNLIRMQEEISNTKAQRDLIKTQQYRGNIENAIASLDLSKYKQTGLNPRNASSIAKQIQDLFSGAGSPAGKQITDQVKKVIGEKINIIPVYYPNPKNENERIANLRYKLWEAQQKQKEGNK